MEFKSQIATTREQSEQLLALGLKPETADMYLEKCMLPEAGVYYIHTLTKDVNPKHWFSVRMNRDIIPAWSLARLLELMPKTLEQTNRPNANLDINSDRMYWFISYEELGYDVKHQEMSINLFDAIIYMISWLISKEYFNAEYLK